MLHYYKLRAFILRSQDTLQHTKRNRVQASWKNLLL